MPWAIVWKGLGPVVFAEMALFLGILAVVRDAGAPVICETAEDGRKDDIAWLRANL